ncbi:MAG: FxDxF family PEP-CTERM protein [Sphingomonas sp.]
MTRFKRILTAAAATATVIGFAGTANATTFLCTPAPGQCSFDGTTGGYGNVKLGAKATASNTFSILFSTAGEAVLTFTTAKLTFLSATFNGLTFTPVAGVEYMFNILTPGTYDLVVNATNPTNSVASFSGTIDVAAVPEPAVWGMMIGGFGLGGMALRRRRKLGAAALA